ncbi:Protein of unknown function, partial [Gryllus bimaculatus]
MQCNFLLYNNGFYFVVLQNNSIDLDLTLMLSDSMTNTEHITKNSYTVVIKFSSNSSMYIIILRGSNLLISFFKAFIFYNMKIKNSNMICPIIKLITFQFKSFVIAFLQQMLININKHELLCSRPIIQKISVKLPKNQIHFGMRECILAVLNSFPNKLSLCKLYLPGSASHIISKFSPLHELPIEELSYIYMLDSREDRLFAFKLLVASCDGGALKRSCGRRGEWEEKKKKRHEEKDGDCGALCTTPARINARAAPSKRGLYDVSDSSNSITLSIFANQVVYFYDYIADYNCKKSDEVLKEKMHQILIHGIEFAR